MNEKFSPMGDPILDDIWNWFSDFVQVDENEIRYNGTHEDGDAEAFVEAMVKGEIPHVYIKYGEKK